MCSRSLIVISCQTGRCESFHLARAFIVCARQGCLISGLLFFFVKRAIIRSVYSWRTKAKVDLCRLEKHISQDRLFSARTWQSSALEFVDIKTRKCALKECNNNNNKKSKQGTKVRDALISLIRSLRPTNYR